jgi:hypothetical protein
VWVCISIWHELCQLLQLPPHQHLPMLTRCTPAAAHTQKVQSAVVILNDPWCASTAHSHVHSHGNHTVLRCQATGCFT